MSRLSDIATWTSRHRRLLGAVQLVLLAAFFISLGWALRHQLHSAAHDLNNANLVLFALGCAALGGYYLVDVESKERAIELAKQIPDAGIDGLALEIRPVMYSAGADM